MTTKNSYLEKAKLTSQFVQTKLVSADTLLDLTHNELIKDTIKSVFFPLALLLDLIVNLFTLINFIKLENKNLGNTSKLILSILIIILTLVAVVFFFISSYPILIGICLLAAIGLSFIFNTSIFVYNFYKRFSSVFTEKNNYPKNIYTANNFKFGVAAIVSFIVLSSVLFSVFLFPYLTSGVLIGTGIFSGIALFMGGVYKIINAIKTSTALERKNPKELPFIETISVSNEQERLMDNLRLKVAKREKNSPSFQYYHQRHRSHQLSRDLSNNRSFLLKQIFEKINLLEKEIENNKGKVGERIWMQEEKRIEKIDLLVNLAIFLLPTSEKLADNIIETLETKIPLSELSYKKIML